MPAIRPAQVKLIEILCGFLGHGIDAERVAALREDEATDLILFLCERVFGHVRARVAPEHAFPLYQQVSLR